MVVVEVMVEVVVANSSDHERVHGRHPLLFPTHPLCDHLFSKTNVAGTSPLVEGEEGNLNVSYLVCGETDVHGQIEEAVDAFAAAVGKIEGGGEGGHAVVVADFYEVVKSGYAPNGVSGGVCVRCSRLPASNGKTGGWSVDRQRY